MANIPELEKLLEYHRAEAFCANDRPTVIKHDNAAREVAQQLVRARAALGL
jgi:hypothetical protein